MIRHIQSHNDVFFNGFWSTCRTSSSTGASRDARIPVIPKDGIAMDTYLMALSHDHSTEVPRQRSLWLAMSEYNAVWI